VTVSPVRRQPNLDFRLLPDDTNAHGEDTVAFLAQLRGEIRLGGVRLGGVRPSFKLT